MIGYWYTFEPDFLLSGKTASVQYLNLTRFAEFIKTKISISEKNWNESTDLEYSYKKRSIFPKKKAQGDVQ